MMGSIGDMAYLASRSDVLIASQAIFHLSHLKFVGVPTCSCQGRSQATRSMRRMAASRAPTAAASCSLPSGPRGSRMARSSWAAMSSFIPRSRSWLPSVIGHLSLYVTALVVELLRLGSNAPALRFEGLLHQHLAGMSHKRVYARLRRAMATSGLCRSSID